MNEEALIGELRQGSAMAFTQLVEAYQHMVHNVVLNIVNHAQEAEDVAQEVFIQVYQQVHHFRGEAKLSTWLYRIAITKALECERKKKAKKRFHTLKTLIGIGDDNDDLAIDFHHPGIQLDNKEKAATLFKAMKQLPDNQRTAFMLIKAEGLSYEEVSGIMSITVKAVEALMHRAKENLRKTLSVYYKND